MAYSSADFQPDVHDEDFSIVLGGPFYKVLARRHLTATELHKMWHRIAIVAAITWLPLLVLSSIEGNFLVGTARISFVYGIETHLRLLVAIPLLIYAELAVHNQTSRIIGLFLKRGIVPPEEVPAFKKIVTSAKRVRDSIVIEVLLLVFVYSVGHRYFVVSHEALKSTWYAPDGQNLTLAGYWYEYFCVPLYQFILCRWIVRLFIWSRLLFSISRLKLRLVAIHPDRMAGLGFLRETPVAFSSLLMSVGAIISALIANRIFFTGATLPEFKEHVFGAVMCCITFVLLPLCVFAPNLLAIRQRGLFEYEMLATLYVANVHEKWIAATNRNEGVMPPLPDFSSVLPFSGGLEIIKSISPFPFDRRAVIQCAWWVLLPIFPLVLTVIPFDSILDRLIKIVL